MTVYGSLLMLDLLYRYGEQVVGVRPVEDRGGPQPQHLVRARVVGMDPEAPGSDAGDDGVGHLGGLRVRDRDAGRVHLALELLDGRVRRTSRAGLGEPVRSRPPRLEQAGAQHVRPGEEHRRGDRRPVELPVEALGDRDDGGLRRGVLRRRREGGDAAVAGRGVDDVPLLALLQQHRDERLDAVDHTPDVDRQSPLPVAQLVLPHRALGAGADPGVVADHVDRAVRRQCRVAQRLDRLVGRHVGRHPDDVEPVALQLRHGLGERLLLDVGEDHLHARESERLAERPADPAATTGDDGHPPLENLHQSEPTGDRSS
jgi:hypothetical protein